MVNNCLCQSLKACCVGVLSKYEARAKARKRRSALQPAKGEMEKESMKQSENPSPLSSDSDRINITHAQTLNYIEGKSLSTGPHGYVTPPPHTAVHSEEHGGSIGDTDTKTTAALTRRLNEPHGNAKGEGPVVRMHDSKTNVNSHKSNTEAAAKQRIKTDVTELGAEEGCAVPGHCGPPDVATAVFVGPLRGHKMIVERTDEAVWAAAALGFLLVLLTLSVLHTRLYRNCRVPSSLYWHESQQDYESVAGTSLQIKFTCSFTTHV